MHLDSIFPRIVTRTELTRRQGNGLPTTLSLPPLTVPTSTATHTPPAATAAAAPPAAAAATAPPAAAVNAPAPAPAPTAAPAAAAQAAAARGGGPLPPPPPPFPAARPATQNRPRFYVVVKGERPGMYYSR